MTTRTTETSVTFHHPFRVDGEDDPFAAGTYLVHTDEESIDGLSFLGWRRVATTIHVRRNGSTQVLPIDPTALAFILSCDAEDAARA
jgi:hypothetical protein